MILCTRVPFCGRQVTIVCDAQCALAWGISWEGEKGAAAPIDPGSYEGGDGKPKPPYPPDRHNRWCARECERPDIFPHNPRDAPVWDEAVDTIRSWVRPELDPPEPRG